MDGFLRTRFISDVWIILVLGGFLNRSKDLHFLNYYLEDFLLILASVDCYLISLSSKVISLNSGECFEISRTTYKY